MKFDKQDKVVKAPDALNNPLYNITKVAVKAAKIRNCIGSLFIRKYEVVKN